MAYAIQREETVPAAVRRIMDEQLVRAREQLMDAANPLDKRVHDARKRFKETRALIRLVRDPLGDQYTVENAWFRDVGRDLAAARDADAVLEALQKLELPDNIRSNVQEQLEAHRDAMPRAELEARVVKVLDQLVVAQARVGMWPELDDSFAAIARGLLRTYRSGRRSMRDAHTPEELHEWRKRVKEHWYHMQLLRHVWPEMMKPWAAVLETLSRALGDHHDLVVLRGRAGDPPPELTQAIDARQKALEEQAREIGRRLYAEKPAAWLARMRNVWRAWRTS